MADAERYFRNDLNDSKSGLPDADALRAMLSEAAYNALQVLTPIPRIKYHFI